MNADVEKAVERAEVRNEMRGDSGRYPNGEGWGHCFRVDGFWLPKDAWQTIRQALRDQKAEISRLKKVQEAAVAWRFQIAELEMRVNALTVIALGSGFYEEEEDLERAVTAHLGGEQ